jgi:predicted RNA-binding protein YlqC (UPF0109 family)
LTRRGCDERGFWTMEDELKELLEYLAKSLVDHPEDVTVVATETDNTVVLELRVAQDDIGKVIGKQGRIARALRTVVKASAIKNGKRALVEIVD